MADASQAEKVALVTGGARGIGEGIVRLFLKKGVGHVYFCDIRTNETLTTSNCKFIQCDVTKDDQIKACVDKVIAECGRLDYLVNNAGWHPPHKPIDDFSTDDFRKLFDLNVTSVFAFCKFALPHIRSVKGSIVCISSISNIIGQPGASSYCASKAAITGLMKALAIDEASHGVRINCVAPTNTLTPLWMEPLSKMPKEEADRVLRVGSDAQLIGRLNTTEEVAEAVWYLAVVATSTTGLELMVTGGAELSYGKKTRIGASPYEGYIDLH